MKIFFEKVHAQMTNLSKLSQIFPEFLKMTKKKHCIIHVMPVVVNATW